MLKSTVLAAAERFDALLPPAVRHRGCERRLVILLVHSLYQRVCDADEAGVFPHERMTVDKLRQFLECFLEMDYKFVSPGEVRTSDRLPNKAMMLTFDDGYYNFVHALPMLHEYQIPATFFVSPGYIVNQESFWWDAFYRNARASGAEAAKTRRQIARLRKSSFDHIHRNITNLWGKHAMSVATDLDRPLALDELRDVVRDPLVHLGNHTFHHTALPFQTKTTIRDELRLAEVFFEREFQQTPRVISYPNGDYANFVTALCADHGYELGMTIDARWNTHLEYAAGSQLLSLGRYMLSGDRDVMRQAKSINLPYSVSSSIRRLKKHTYN